MHLVEEKGIFIVGREGFYPKLGSLTTGSGFAYGVGYRDRDLFDNKGTLDLWAATSLRRYWATEARLTFPQAGAQPAAGRSVGGPSRLSSGGLLWHWGPTRLAPIRPATPSARTSSARASAFVRCRLCSPEPDSSI